MNIVVSNVKGGVGKTTTSVYLAAVAVERGYRPVVLVDADRQASSAEWFEQSAIDGVELVEAPSERTVGRAMAARTMRSSPGGVSTTTMPSEPAIARADAVVIPTRAGGVEFSRVAATLEMIDGETPAGIVICAARLGTNDLAETIEWWTAEKVPIWGVVPERVGIAAGPESRLYREGLDEYDAVMRRAIRKRH
jgi:chromosome partitioning protein